MLAKQYTTIYSDAIEYTVKFLVSGDVVESGVAVPVAVGDIVTFEHGDKWEFKEKS